MFSQKLLYIQILPILWSKHYPLCEIFSDFLWWMSLLWIPKALDLQLCIAFIIRFWSWLFYVCMHMLNVSLCLWGQLPYSRPYFFYVSHIPSQHRCSETKNTPWCFSPIIFLKKILPNPMDPSSCETASRAFPPPCSPYSGCRPHQQCHC